MNIFSVCLFCIKYYFKIPWQQQRTPLYRFHIANTFMPLFNINSVSTYYVCFLIIFRIQPHSWRISETFEFRKHNIKLLLDVIYYETFLPRCHITCCVALVLHDFFYQHKATKLSKHRAGRALWTCACHVCFIV